MERRAQTIQWIQAQVKDGEHLVVAVSGGPDSILLLDLIGEALEGRSFSWVAAHLNHGLRAVSDQEEADLKAYCEERKIPFVSRQADCAAYAKENRLSLEEAGRRMRYQFFHELLGEQRGWIATGHHKNDQAETVLFHLFRGSGAKGLRGIPALEPPMIRPLYNWRREEILEACDARGLPYFIDESNADTDFTRNWIRHELSPKIESKFDAGVIDRIVQTSELVAADDAYLQRRAEAAYEEMAEPEAGGVRIDREKLKVLEAPILSRVVLIAISRVFGTTKDIHYGQISRAMEMICTGHSGRKFEFSMGRSFCMGNQAVYFGADSDHEAYRVPLSVPGATQVPGGVVTIEWRNREEDFNDPFTIEIDYDKIQGRLFWRTQEPGDWFSLGQGKGTKRIQRFWIDQKVPVHQRGAWPLLADEARVLWVVGLRKCEEKPPVDSKSICIKYQVL